MKKYVQLNYEDRVTIKIKLQEGWLAAVNSPSSYPLILYFAVMKLQFFS